MEKRIRGCPWMSLSRTRHTLLVDMYETPRDVRHGHREIDENDH